MIGYQSLVNLFAAILQLGLPMTIMSWLMFHWLYSRGELDRESKPKAIQAQIKKMKKPFRAYENKKARFIYGKWAWFGGGFYGLAGLWTFLVVEIVDAFNFFAEGNLSTLFDESIVSFLVNFLINQLGNSIQALLWFSYWSVATGSLVICVGVAYLGYWIGVELARRDARFPIRLGFKQNSHSPTTEQTVELPQIKEE